MKVLIVDDEAPARTRLQQMLNDDDEHTVVGDASNGNDAVQAVAALKPDVVLLDIRMPGMSGIEAAHHINELEEPPAIVFTTAYDQYAIDAFDAQAIGYVLKPVRRERLMKALAQAARINRPKLDKVAESPGFQTARSHICSRLGDELKLISIEDIAYFQSDQKYTRVSHNTGESLIDDSLKQLEEEFPEQFVRIHRGALVAVKHIDSLQKTEDGEVFVKLREHASNGAEDALKVSRRHVAAVRRRLRGRAQ